MRNQPELPLVGDTVGPRAQPSRFDDWRLDEATRRVGQLGLVAARAALARSAPSTPRPEAA